MTSRKKPGVAFWATVVVVVMLVAYPLSFGPACWYVARTGIHKPHPWFGFIYLPIVGGSTNAEFERPFVGNAFLAPGSALLSLL